MKTLTVAAACAFLALSSVAAAQVPGTRYTPRMPSVDMTTRYGGSAAEHHNRLAGQLVDPTLAETDAATEERNTLIERIAPMVAEGRCNEARREARAAGDRAVSRRIGEVCVEGRPTPMEAPAAS